MKLRYFVGYVLATGWLAVFPDIGLAHGGGGGGGGGGHGGRGRWGTWIRWQWIR